MIFILKTMPSIRLGDSENLKQGQIISSRQFRESRVSHRVAITY